MAIDISSTTRRIVYTGSAGVGPYAFNFEVLTQTDIAVYFNTTELTLTTDYTVSISGSGTGSVTIVVGTNVPSTPTASDRITIVGDRTIARSTDFTTGGPLFATSLNDEFDSQTIFVQQVLEQSDRSLRAPNTDPTTINMTLPLNTVRANKTLAFDADGNPTTGEIVGNWRGNWAAGEDYVKRDLVKDTTNNNVYICVTAHTSSGSLPISSNADVAKWDLMVDAASATSSATAAASSATAAASSATAAASSATSAASSATSASSSATTATTQASNASTSATAAASSATSAASSASAAAAYVDNFDDTYLGAKASNPTVDNDGDPLQDGALYFDTTNDVMKVYDLGTTTWYQLTPTVSNQTNINTVAGIASDVTTVAGISSNVTTVSGIASDVTTVAADGTDIGTVAGISANVTTVAGNTSNINTVATNDANITTVAGISANVTTVAGISADVSAVAADATDIGTVATNIANVNSVGTNIASVNTVATNVTDVVTFATTYLGAFSSAPSTSVTGALYYNTSSNQLYVWNGSAWDAAAFSVSGTVTSFNTRTGAVTLSSADVTGALTYTPYDAANVSAFGGTLIDDADAATARTTLGLGTAATTASSDYATSAQGTLADSAVQPSDNVSTLTNDSGYLTSTTGVTKTASTGSGVLPAGTTAQRDGSPAAGYIRFNSDDTSFEGYDGSAWGSIGGGGGASAGGAIYENNDTITSSYTIAAGKNGHSVGPITISSGAAVTITSGQRWVVA